MTESDRNECWHLKDAEQTARELGADLRQGLREQDADARLLRYGANEISAEKPRGILKVAAAQFSDFMILVLIAAAIVSGLVGELRDSVAILVIVILNAAVGGIQDYRAQRAIAALRRLSVPEAKVTRAGRTRSIAATRLVPGDVVSIEAGDVVAADLRLAEAHELRADESTLTGESLPVDKTVSPLRERDLPIADRSNMLFKSTSIAGGRGRGVVVGTGERTEIGRIAGLLRQASDTRTPLQHRLARFGRHLAYAILAICAFIFLIGISGGTPPLLMFLTAVSLAVAAVPEALPAVVTVALALGAKKLSAREALVRRLQAVESLGSVTFICADKTGTLTENRMALAAIFANGSIASMLPEATANRLWQRLGQGLALNNEVDETPLDSKGDPTEVALVKAASEAGFDKTALSQSLPRIGEIAFDSERKRMTTLHRLPDGGVVAFTKGAPESLVSCCMLELDESGEKNIADAEILKQAEAFASQGQRVLAVAFRELPDLPQPCSAADVEKRMTFLGLVALSDPPREGVSEAVARCKRAGISPVMITGDHPETARRVALSLHIAEESEQVITGKEFANLSDAALDGKVRHLHVYARVSPEQKVRIVKSLQRAGEYVAMTGDGVNDAPALKESVIGVAMGKRGTDVAREAADMVLLDDNFATIVTAVAEGRRIYDNIRKFIKYTMTSNAGEIWTLLLAPLMGLPIPLLPIQILWVNLVTDGLPGLALSAEPAERNVMSRPPRAPQESVFAHGMWQYMLWVGLLIGALSLGAQAFGYLRHLGHWQTMVFTTLVVSQLFNALAVRSSRDSLWSIGIGSNPHLLGAVAITVVAQLAVIYVPALNVIFKTTPLPLTDLLLCFGLSAVVLPVVEVEKWLRRRGS